MPVVAGIRGNSGNQILTLQKHGRGPVLGASATLTARVDSGGLSFFSDW